MQSMINNSIIKLDEPELTFGHNQNTYDPRDGLTLFGPISRTKVSDIKLGIIGTSQGIQRMTNWLYKIQRPVKSLDNDLARPFFPGFEAAFEGSINFNAIQTIKIDPDKISHFLKYTDSHQRVYRLVNLYTEELLRYKKEEETPIQVWFVVIPDEIYTFGRPKSRVPITDDSIGIGIKDRDSRIHPQLFEVDIELQKAYLFPTHFHNQLKYRLLKDQIITQIIREGTIAYKEILNVKGKPKRDLAKFESAIAWNISNTLLKFRTPETA